MEKGKFNRAAFDPTQLQKFVDEVIEGGAGGGGGFEVPSFTAATFEIDLPDAEIHLSAADCADIVKNKYPLFNLVASINEEDSVILTFVCNNIFNSTEHDKPFVSLQYIMFIDDDDEVYEIGLNFAQDETINKSWAMKLNGEGGGSSVASPYALQDYELDISEETFSCSAADAEYIFQNNPVAISLGGTIAIAKNFVDDDSKNDHIRGYTFFDLEGEDQIIYYEIGLYWDGEEYSFDIKPTDPIGGGGSGTEVVANPTLEGTESDLIGLEVDGTKYRVPQFEIQPNLKGKKISFIGDSITTYSGYLPSGNATRYPRGAITNVNQTWWKQLIDQTGMVLGQNCAWDGSTCIGRSTSTTNAYGACSAKRISQLGLNGNPDIIICFIGINDWGATYNSTGTHYGSPFTNGAFVPVGSYTGETAAPSGDLQTFSEAYGSMLYNIQVKYPNAKIYCCTLLQTNGKATYNYDADGVFPSINRDGVTLAAYNECIRTLAKNIGAEVIEFAKCGINWGNMSTYLEDGLHPNVAGMRLLCASAKAKLEADFGYTTESFTPLQTFSVTNNLTNVNNSNNATTATENSTYSASLTADVGYTISSVTITMGGTDITSSAYSGGAINIGNVTGNIVITASATLNVYSVTNSLTNVTNSNQATSINHGNSYSATLTIPSGYTMQSVSIQMSGVDITSTVYSNNEINISSVTGNIIITAVATDQVTYSITNNLSNVTNSNASVSIAQGDSYNATLTPSTHYELQTANVSILMGGTDVTGTAYDGSTGAISIASVSGALVINATATIITHTITNTLTHTTNSNNAVSANDGSSYSGTLTADTGYNISSVSVAMGGVDITSTAYSNGVITISSVTGDIVIQCVSTAVVYSITNNLTNATGNNPASTISYGSSYNATITADAGYQIASASVSMSGVDITNTAYNNGVISIASVTGDLVITITALDPTVITWYTNFSQTSTSSFVASSKGWALDEVTYANIYNKPINRISLVATASSGSIDICVAPSKNAQSGFTQQQTINWTSANKVGNIVTLELPTPITLATGEYLCVYVNSTPATGAACYATGGSAGQFYSYVGVSGRAWGEKGTYSIQFNIGYKA